MFLTFGLFLQLTLCSTNLSVNTQIPGNHISMSCYPDRGLEGFGFVFLVLGFRFGFLSVAGH